MQSVLALLAFGLVLLRLGRRSRPAMFLGVFAVLWGLDLLLVRIAVVQPDGPGPRLLQAAALPFYAPLYLLLAHFASIFPGRLRLADHPLWPLALGLPGLAAIYVLLTDWQAVMLPGDGTIWGWAFFLLLFLPFFGAQVAVALRFALGARGPPGDLRDQCFLGALAFLPYVVGSAVALLAFHAGSRAVADRLGPSGDAVYLAALVAGLLAASTSAWLAGAGAGPRRRLALGLAVAVPGLAALAANPLGSDLIGLWRTWMMAVLSYAVAKHAMFDLEVRLRSVVRPLARVGAGLAAWGVFATAGWYLARSAGAGEPELLLASGLAGAGVGWLAGPALDRFLDRGFPYLPADEEYVRRRKVEVYRAAEAAGTSPARLDALARELGLDAEGRRGAAAGAEAVAGLPARYLVERVLARTSRGRVLAALDRRVGERVVLKEYAMGAEGAARFAREAKVLGDIRHPNVLPVRDVFRAGDHVYLVTALAEGGSLADRLRGGARPSSPQALAVVEEVLRGLAHLHRRRLVHRDLKPANILFHRGRACIADFDIALEPLLEPLPGATARGRAAGTPGWMAPEQAGGQPATRASDTYAVGLVLREMLGPPVPDGGREGVPEAVRAFLARALAEEPGLRYAHAGAMLRALRKVVRSLPGARTPPPWAPAPARAPPERDAHATLAPPE